MFFLLLMIFVIRVINCQSIVEATNEEGFNPDSFLDTPQIIRRHGYSSETHIVETRDGCLLSVHRIPCNKYGKRGGQPIFLQHGLLSSSTDWVSADNSSLAFILSDFGYDVWLGNARGNTYSKAHIQFPIESAIFWNFSFHEMAIYDLPVVLSYIGNITAKEYNQEIIYIGHSMGTTMFFVLSSFNPDIIKKVKVMVGLAPVAYMTHIKSPIRYLSPWVYDYEVKSVSVENLQSSTPSHDLTIWLAHHFGLNQFLPNNKIMELLAYDCKMFNIDERICQQLIFVLCGFDKAEFNEKVLPVVLTHDPAGTSTKTVLHYAQEIKNSGNFQQYDYGPNGNRIKYGQLIPPVYNLSNINVPTFLMYAENDWLASPIDVLRLATKLKKNVGTYKIPLNKFNHVDFLFGKHAPEVVYKPLIEFLKKYTTH